MALALVDKPFELVSALPATPASRLADYSDRQLLRPTAFALFSMPEKWPRVHSDEVIAGCRDRGVAGRR